jgi:hypothetical protein
MSAPAPGDPRDHMNALLGLLLPFARDTIGEHGEVYPFGAAMLPDGELQAAATWEGEERPTAEQVLTTLRDGLRERASKGELLATGVVTAVTIEDGEYPLGIRVELEHRDVEPITCVVPYRETGDAYEYGEVVAFAGERRTWD